MKNLEILLQEVTMLKMENIKPNFSELARMHDCDRRTVKKYFNDEKNKTKRKNKFSKLDKYREEIENKLIIPGITASALYRFLKDKYKDEDIGSESNLRAYILKNELRKKAKNDFHPRYETSYGKQMQFDWKENITLTNRNGIPFTFNVFSAILCASRFHVFQYSKNKTRTDVERCLVRSFEIMGGIPDSALTDNMSSIVNTTTKKFDKKFISFAKDMGIKIKRCKVRHPFTKGKVESANRFINWIKPYDGEFETEEDLKRIIEKIMEMANNEVNETTGVPPIMLYQKEREYLNPLPQEKLMDEYKKDTISTKVSNSALIYYKGKRYSVSPDYINKTVYLIPTGNKLYIYYNKKLIKEHTISEKNINYDKEDYIAGLKQVMPEIEETELESQVETQLKLLDEILT